MSSLVTRRSPEDDVSKVCSTCTLLCLPCTLFTTCLLLSPLLSTTVEATGVVYGSGWSVEVYADKATDDVQTLSN